MDRENAINQLKGNLKAYVQSITKKSAGSNMYICPLCGSGSGTHKTGAFSIQSDGKSWKCFACNQGGDLLDLIGLKEGITDFNRKFQRACEIFNLQLDRLQGASGAGAAAHQAHAQRDQSEANDRSEAASAEAPGVDYTAFYLEANKHLSETTYHRGISLETLNRFNVGYVAAWKHPKAPPAVPSSPRLIIPTSKESYLARDTRPNVTAYKALKVGDGHFFNIEALEKSQKPIHIVEGEIDALSIIDVGGEAIALGSVSMIRNFTTYVKDHRPAKPLILALDNDDAGKKAESALAKSLKSLGIPFYRPQPEIIEGQSKDANKALEDNREAFKESVAERETGAEAQEQQEKQEEGRAYLESTQAYFALRDFLNGVKASVNTPAVSTGFEKLDNILDGGLFEGLYVVGGISSVGKTTFVLQMADQIAKRWQDVLIFSLEMAKTELVAKSISRLTMQMILDHEWDSADLTREQKMKLPKTARGITDGRRYEGYTDAYGKQHGAYSESETGLICEAIKRYKGQYSQCVFIREGMGNVGPDQIREVIAQHINHEKQKPVVIVDYLQLLAAPADMERATDKQIIDKNIMEMKRISRDFKIPVIGISSFNRMSYESKASMAAFKESGAIEYSSDVLMALQLKGTGGDNFDVAEAKDEDAREIELMILKNRNGPITSKKHPPVAFKYYPMFNLYREQ